MLIGIRNEIRRDKAAVELHAFDNFETVSVVWDSLMVKWAPSAPTFSTATKLPTAELLCAEIVAHLRLFTLTGHEYPDGIHSGSATASRRRPISMLCISLSDALHLLAPFAVQVPLGS